MSNSTGWIIAVVVLLLVIAGGAFFWLQYNASPNTSGAQIETNLPLGGNR
jgi:multidrug resistance efflux pump